MAEKKEITKVDIPLKIGDSAVFEKTKIPLTSLDRYLDKLIALDLIQKKGSRKTVSYNVKNTDI